MLVVFFHSCVQISPLSEHKLQHTVHSFAFCFSQLNECHVLRQNHSTKQVHWWEMGKYYLLQSWSYTSRRIPLNRDRCELIFSCVHDLPLSLCAFVSSVYNKSRGLEATLTGHHAGGFWSCRSRAISFIIHTQALLRVKGVLHHHIRSTVTNQGGLRQTRVSGLPDEPASSPENGDANIVS